MTRRRLGRAMPQRCRQGCDGAAGAGSGAGAARTGWQAAGHLVRHIGGKQGEPGVEKGAHRHRGGRHLAGEAIGVERKDAETHIDEQNRHRAGQGNQPAAAGLHQDHGLRWAVDRQASDACLAVSLGLGPVFIQRNREWVGSDTAFASDQPPRCRRQ